MIKGLAILRGNPQADRVVPQEGIAARLTIFVSAVMGFLAVIALAVATTTARLADSWGEDLAASATVRLPADPEQADALLLAAQQVLETTPGVQSVRVLLPDEQQALLEPWFGPDLPLADLPVPQLIEVVTGGDGFDADGLRARLSAQVPGAVFDDHSAWRAPLVRAARTVQWIGWGVTLLILLTVAAMISLAGQAALAANGQVIAVLRLVGATDAYIARAFVRRLTLQALLGAVIGSATGTLAVLLIPQGAVTDSFAIAVGFNGVGWLLPLVIAPLSAITAFAATRRAAMRRLKEQR